MEQYTNHNDLALEVNGATKIFGGVTVLDHVNFSLRKGEVHILIGEKWRRKVDFDQDYCRRIYSERRCYQTEWGRR